MDRPSTAKQTLGLRAEQFDLLVQDAHIGLEHDSEVLIYVQFWLRSYERFNLSSSAPRIEQCFKRYFSADAFERKSVNSACEFGKSRGRFCRMPSGPALQLALLGSGFGRDVAQVDQQTSKSIEFRSFALARFKATAPYLPNDKPRANYDGQRTNNSLRPGRDVRAAEIRQEAEVVHGGCL